MTDPNPDTDTEGRHRHRPGVRPTGPSGQETEQQFVDSTAGNGNVGIGTTAEPGTSWAPERTIAEFCDFFWPISLFSQVAGANNYSVYAQVS